jgi:hypothetical protein
MATDKSKPPFYLIDTSAEFYRPPMLRYGVCVAAAAWAGMELYIGEPFWMVIAVAVAIYCVYVLVITYKPPAPKPAPVLDEATPDDAETSSEDPEIKP